MKIVLANFDMGRSWNPGLELPRSIFYAFSYKYQGENLRITSMELPCSTPQNVLNLNSFKYFSLCHENCSDHFWH